MIAFIIWCVVGYALGGALGLIAAAVIFLAGRSVLGIN